MLIQNTFQTKIASYMLISGILKFQFKIPFPFKIYTNNSKLKYHKPANKSDFSMMLGFEIELNGQTPVGSWRCQTVLTHLKCHWLRQIKRNQVYVWGFMLRALSLCSCQQWALQWIAFFTWTWLDLRKQINTMVDCPDKNSGALLCSFDCNGGWPAGKKTSKISFFTLVA